MTARDTITVLDIDVIGRPRPKGSMRHVGQGRMVEQVDNRDWRAMVTATARANLHGVFRNPIDWEIEGKGDTLSVTAFAELAGTGRRVEVTIDMATAKREGWTKNAKYQSIPEQMLRYRSAAFLIRLYCPEVMIGLPASAEIEDGMRDVSPPEVGELLAAATVGKPVAALPEYIVPETDADAGEMVEDEGHDPETGEVKAKPDAKPKAAPKADPKPAAKPREPSPADAAFIENTVNGIEGDLIDGAGWDDTMDAWSSQIDEIKRLGGRSKWDEIEARLKDTAAKVAEGDSGDMFGGRT